MLLDFVWHVIYLGYLFATKQMTLSLKTTIIPLPKDILDVIKNYLYFLGLSKEKAKFGKFSYAQKFDYWAVFWGMFIIGSSGFALAFPILVSNIIPQFVTPWIWELLSIMHSDEALLAIVFILFWHFYNEHLKPENFPMSWLWITGRMSTETLKHHHPLEYEYLFPEDAKKQKKDQGGMMLRTISIVSLVILLVSCKGKPHDGVKTETAESPAISSLKDASLPCFRCHSYEKFAWCWGLAIYPVIKS